MIKVLGLGHIRTVIGKDGLTIKDSPKKIRDILDLISSLDKSLDGGNYNLGNTLLMVNGVESSALGGQDTVIYDGDEVVLIPVVHGG